jgi:hypothetical protein
LRDHKKFFDKSKDAKYLKEHLIKKLKPLTERFNEILNIQATEYHEKVERREKVKKHKKKQKKRKWDFIESKGEGSIIPTKNGDLKEENKIMDENGQNDSFDFDLKEEDCVGTNDDNDLNKSKVIVS